MSRTRQKQPPELFCKKAVVRKCAKVTGKDLCQSLFLIKLQASGNFIKKETLAKVFSCEFVEIYKTTFLTEYLRWLLLAFRVNTLCDFRTSCSKQAQYLTFK